MLEALFESIAKCFGFFTAKKEHQAETEIISDSEKQVKAIKYADEALEMVIEKNGYLADSDLKFFKKLKDKFDKYKIN